MIRLPLRNRITKYRIVGTAFVFVSVMSMGALITDAQTSRTLFSDNSGAEPPFVLADRHVSILTASSFNVVVDRVVTVLPFKTVYEDDEDMFVGEELLVQEGMNGEKIETFNMYYWNNTLFNRELLSTKKKDPVTQIIRRGTKKNVRVMNTPFGELKYYQKLTMWSTSYDGNCVGCTGKTYTGTNVHHGVCAVDPSVIPLGTYMYIPGYGVCHAEDVGGAIRGNMIDLGFEDVSKGWWSARYTDVYLLEM